MPRKLSLSITLGMVVLLSWLLLAGNISLAYAQCVPPRCFPTAVPPAPTAPPPSRPGLTFSESAPFRPIPQVQPTATNTSTSTPVNTATSTPTETATPTSTSTPTSTPTRTPTATPTSTPFPSGIFLNEIMPKPRNVDWNNDKSTGVNDEWVELYNGGFNAADIGGWMIDTGDKTLAFTIPPSTTIPSRGFVTFFRDQSHLALESNTQVRLLFPSGAIADAVQYPAIGDDQTYARSKDGEGTWRTGCMPSPNSNNCVVIGSITTNFGIGYFRENIASPAQSGLDPNVLVTNILLAIILALAMGFFSNLLNDAIESHEDQVNQMLGPVTTTLKRARTLGGNFDRWMGASNLAWLGFVIKLVIILLIYGTILAFLDPSFTFITPDGLMLIIALGLSTGLIGLVDDIASYIYLKMRGASSAIRMHSGNLIVVIFSTLFSRITGLVPGLILGSPAGIEDVQDTDNSARLDLLAIGTTALVAVGAWLIAPLFQNDAWFNTLFLLIFAAGVQTVFFEMMPLSYLHGKGIFQSSRLLWLFIFALITAIFLQTMLNPDGAFVSAFNSPNMALLSGVVVAYCLFCTAMWFYFRRIDNKQLA